MCIRDRTYNVFNVQQTNLQETKPEKWEALKEQFKICLLYTSDFWDLLKQFIDNKLPDDYLFLNRYNQPMSRFCIYEMIKKYSQEIGRAHV